MVSDSVRLKIRLSSLKLGKSALAACDIRSPMTHGGSAVNGLLRRKQRGLAGSGYEAYDLPARRRQRSHGPLRPGRATRLAKRRTAL